MLRITLSIILASSGLSVAWSAPEDRGPRGSYIALSAGASLGTALDDDGNSAGSNTGQSFQLRFGEEVFDRFTLGLSIAGGSAEGNQGLYSSFHGGLLMDFSWQVHETIPFLLQGGTGLGVGRLEETKQQGFNGSVAGGIHMVGTQYDVRWRRASGSEFTASPFARGYFLPATGDAKASMVVWSIGVETAWVFGRE